MKKQHPWPHLININDVILVHLNYEHIVIMYRLTHAIRTYSFAKEYAFPQGNPLSSTGSALSLPDLSPLNQIDLQYGMHLLFSYSTTVSPNRLDPKVLNARDPNEVSFRSRDNAEK